LRRAENDTLLETEVDDAPRKRKPPRRYIDSDKDDEDEENNMPPRKDKGSRKNKIRKLSESSNKSENKTLPQVNSDILNAVKETIHVQDKEKEKMRRGSLSRTISSSESKTIPAKAVNENKGTCKRLAVVNLKVILTKRKNSGKWIIPSKKSQ